MGKKGGGGAGNKAAAKAAKKAKTVAKDERSQKKKAKGKAAAEEDDDLEAILDKMRLEWETAHKVTEELVEGPPSRRANATFIPCPSGNYLWCIGGEFFSEDKKAYFYNDVFRYSPDKDEWRKFVSPTCPGPRSAHAAVATPSGGGKIFIFGGEFSSLSQNSFHHYRDFWCFDVQTHTWDRIETKVKPTPRSGHRMAVWKHYIVLFGGFHDAGLVTRYLNDLWVFDTQEYVWRQIEFREGELRPSARSGFSFLPTPEGILLHGGYCKEYVKGKRPVGVMLEDTWFLNLSIPTSATPASATPSTPTASSSKSKNIKSAASSELRVKWERRKRGATQFAPGARVGCTMALWAAKGMGILFGGVTDEDTDEESLVSVFHRDLFGYQIAGKGRWVSLTLRKPKKKGGPQGGGRGKKGKASAKKAYSDDEDGDANSDVETATVVTMRSVMVPRPGEDIDPNDPDLTIPLPRYNTMLAVLRNTLYIYGGIFEKGSREYTLDDFHSLQLDKLDRYVCLKEAAVMLPAEGEGEESSSGESEEEEDSGEEDSEMEDDVTLYDGEVPEEEGEGVVAGIGKMKIVEEVDEDVPEPEPEIAEIVLPVEDPEILLRAQATAFMGVAKDDTRSAEDVISTPLPGETLAMFFARSKEHWTGKAIGRSEQRGKELRRVAFGWAEERYAEYKPILEEVEKILGEAGLDEDDIKNGVAAGGVGQAGQNRNRR